MIEFNAIATDLFLGTCPGNETDVGRLRNAIGVTAVLNLQTDADFDKWRIDWPRLEKAYEKHRILVSRKPIADFDRDDLARRVIDAAEGLAALLAVGHRVYVHCTAGRERSPATVIAYLVQARGYSLSEAVEWVTTRRNCAPYVDVLEAVFAPDAGRGDSVFERGDAKG